MHRAASTPHFVKHAAVDSVLRHGPAAADPANHLLSGLHRNHPGQLLEEDGSECVDIRGWSGSTEKPVDLLRSGNAGERRDLEGGEDSQVEEANPAIEIERDVGGREAQMSLSGAVDEGQDLGQLQNPGRIFGEARGQEAP